MQFLPFTVLYNICLLGVSLFLVLHPLAKPFFASHFEGQITRKEILCIYYILKCSIICFILALYFNTLLLLSLSIKMNASTVCRHPIRESYADAIYRPRALHELAATPFIQVSFANAPAYVVSFCFNCIWFNFNSKVNVD